MIKVIDQFVIHNLRLHISTECEITAGKRTFSRQNHNLSEHIYICMENCQWNFNLANSKPKAKATGTVDLKHP